MNQYGYTEHHVVEADGFRVVDATATGERPHDDLIWVGYGGMEGRWLTPGEAMAVASAITEVVSSHVARHKGTLSADGVRGLKPEEG